MMMSQSDDVNPKIWIVRKLGDIGLIILGGMCLTLFIFVIQSELGFWCSVALILGGLVMGVLDIARKWPASWKKQFNYPKSYKYWWMWVVISSALFILFALQVTNTRTMNASGLILIMGMAFVFLGFYQKIISWIFTKDENK